MFVAVVFVAMTFVALTLSFVPVTTPANVTGDVSPFRSTATAPPPPTHNSRVGAVNTVELLGVIENAR